MDPARKNFPVGRHLARVTSSPKRRNIREVGTRASISRTLVAQGSTGPGRALPLEVSPAWRIERVVWDAYHRVIRLKWSRTRSVAAQRQAHETHARDAQDMWTWSHVPTETTRAHGTPHWSDTPRDLPPLTHQRTARRSRRHSPATAPKRPRPTPTLHVHGHSTVDVIESRTVTATSYHRERRKSGAPGPRRADRAETARDARTRGPADTVRPDMRTKSRTPNAQRLLYRLSRLGSAT